jgi:hypothetical protein
MVDTMHRKQKEDDAAAAAAAPAAVDPQLETLQQILEELRKDRAA